VADQLGGIVASLGGVSVFKASCGEDLQSTTGLLLASLLTERELAEDTKRWRIRRMLSSSGSLVDARKISKEAAGSSSIAAGSVARQRKMERGEKQFTAARWRG